MPVGESGVSVHIFKNRQTGQSRVTILSTSFFIISLHKCKCNNLIINGISVLFCYIHTIHTYNNNITNNNT